MTCARRLAGAPQPASSALAASPHKPDPRTGRSRARFSLLLPALALLLGALWLSAPAQAQQSSDNTLSDLTASSATSETGTYSPLDIGTFAAATTSYTATVPFTKTHVKLTPTVSDTTATVGVRKGSTGNFASVTSGSQSAAIGLDVGSNAITVRVTAENSATKDYTVTITRQSLGAPTGFRVSPGNAAFTAEWRPVAGANSYKIEWDAGSASGFSRSATATPGTARHKTIAHSSTNAVVNGSAYKVRVSACSGTDGTTGCGSATAAQTVTPGTPGWIRSFSIGPGRVLNGKNTLYVTWYPVAANGSPVTGYDVHYTTTWYVGDDAEAANTYIYGTLYERMPDPSEGWVRIVHLGGGGERPLRATQQTIVNVELGVGYRVRIRAVNAVGPGPWRHTGYRIPENVRAPDVPSNVRIEPGDGKLTLRWTAPGRWGTWPAAGYEILWKRSTAGSKCPVVGDSRETAACAAFWKPVWKDGSPAVIGPGETSFEFSGAQHGSETVTNATSYDLRIRGWNKRPGTDGSADKDRRATPFWFPAKVSGAPTNSPVVPESPGLDRPGDTRPLLETCAAHLPANAVSVAEVTGWRDEHPHLAAHVLRWNRVLEALGENTGTDVAPLYVDESKANEGRYTRGRWSRVTATLEGIGACVAALTAPDAVPETASGPMVLLTGPAEPVAEGSPARVTVTLSEALAADATVPLTVTRDGSEPEDHGTLAGIEVPAGFTSASAQIATYQDDDTDDERFIVALGALPAGLRPGSRTSVAVTIADDDTEQAQGASYTVPADLVRTVRHYYEINRNKPSRGENWFRVLIAFGAETHATLRPFTVAEAEAEVKKWSGWQRVLDALRKLEAAQEPEPAAPPATPEISIAAGPGVSEGGNAAFTLTAAPAPAADLAVSVTVSQRGAVAHAAALGARTVTIPAGKTRASFTVATVNDAVDESDGAVSAAVGAGSGYTVGAAASAAVAVADDDVPAVSIAAGSGVSEGESAAFTLRAAPAPAADLAVTVTVSQQGAFAQAAALGARTVTIPAGGTEAAFAVATVDDAADEPDGAVSAAVGAGSGYAVGAAANATVAVADDDVLAVTIAAGPAVSEGEAAAFTLTAAPAPAQDLGVSVTVSQQGAFAHAAALGPRTVTIPAGGTEATFAVATVDDAADEPDGGIVATVGAGSGYTVGATASASVAVADDDVSPPELLTKRAIAVEGRDDAAVFQMRLSHAGTAPVSVDWATADGAGEWARTGPARAGADYTASSGTVSFAPGETEKTFRVPILDDAVDEGMEYFLVRFSNPRGGTLAARERETQGLIRNDDHLQKMWLSRFGRTVGSQVTDAVSGRLEGGLAPGAHATFAGQPLDLSKAEDGKALTGVLAGLAQTFGAPAATADDPGSVSGAGEPFARRGIGGRWSDPAAGTTARSIAGRELLLGSAFHVAPARDGSGPGLAAWGRVAHGSFDGAHADDTGRTRVDGEVVTGTLGADAEWDRLLAGVAVSFSDGDGSFDQPASTPAASRAR